MARYCSLPGQLCAIARQETIRREKEYLRTITSVRLLLSACNQGRFARKNTTLFYSSLFTKQAETPINTGGVGGEECTATLHHSSLIVRLRYFSFLGLVIIYVRVWSSFMLRLGHHLCQGLVIIGDGTFACLIFFFPKMVWVKSCEEW